ncbi:hypothetical protein CC2G_008665 [Coprinopsis cinerea AmutBmut pab1-1]|nr:hypothetical protein CC2G_008665 [Coprinopsis cinerea AmutBmut pab1-1]
MLTSVPQASTILKSVSLAFRPPTSISQRHDLRTCKPAQLFLSAVEPNSHNSKRGVAVQRHTATFVVPFLPTTIFSQPGFALHILQITPQTIRYSPDSATVLANSPKLLCTCSFKRPRENAQNHTLTKDCC